MSNNDKAMEYINSLKTAITTMMMPTDILQYILQRIIAFDPTFDLNTLWPSIYITSDVKVIKIFLDMGVNLNWRNPETGSTPIMYLAQSHRCDGFKLMLERGADLTLINENGNGLLHYCNSDCRKILEAFNEQKKTDELLQRNKFLESQCQDMNSKLNFLMSQFEQMKFNSNSNNDDNLIHKKIVKVSENDY